jgi:hypothetical protein
MAFYDVDTPVDHAQQTQQQQASQRMRSDPDIQNAMRGVFTGKYAAEAQQLPAAWPPQIRNAVMAHTIASDKGINDSGLDATNNWAPTNTGTPFVVQIAPYVVGGIATAGAAGAFGSGTGTATGTGTGVGLGETGATTGVASGAGLPGATAIPTVADLATTGSAIPGIANAATIGGGAGGGGAATSWLTSPYAGLVSQGFQTIGGIIGANISASAQDKALAQQQAQFDAALAAQKEEQTYNRNQYGDYLGRLAPYEATGGEANARLSQYMGTPQASGGTNVPSTVSALPPPPGSGPAASVVPPQSAPPSAPPVTAAPTTGGATVRMRGPDGSERDVPANQVAHYQGLGATIIGNRYHPETGAA